MNLPEVAILREAFSKCSQIGVWEREEKDK